ncbi:hypothetical protein VOLCADRAFT_91813 [Volvox carteri f. nagariensis]|uniref:Uncharacterized protein n=1 Tax=Volvox carteri f. nagariensis TaxID=3068 RepID=D8TY09_VOLCA|nr:uncharacterized protein VOLCADRAFT_91813 [Volvox carteri f. nagariensis]EFJ47563.1 hypothetical protein VOLCADRAFT_91813 [Volvox carteri f. nagariensis]|eukprot:XP_002951387.1 hypothetical protein VOLCADRAFT_91813 [Volvox carteri f. nagariensis]
MNLENFPQISLTTAIGFHIGYAFLQNNYVRGIVMHLNFAKVTTQAWQRYITVYCNMEDISFYPSSFRDFNNKSIAHVWDSVLLRLGRLPAGCYTGSISRLPEKGWRPPATSPQIAPRPGVGEAASKGLAERLSASL